MMLDGVKEKRSRRRRGLSPAITVAGEAPFQAPSSIVFSHWTHCFSLSAASGHSSQVTPKDYFHLLGWQELADFWRTQHIPSDLSEIYLVHIGILLGLCKVSYYWLPLKALPKYYDFRCKLSPKAFQKTLKLRQNHQHLHLNHHHHHHHHQRADLQSLHGGWWQKLNPAMTQQQRRREPVMSLKSWGENSKEIARLAKRWKFCQTETCHSKLCGLKWHLKISFPFQ